MSHFFYEGEVYHKRFSPKAHEFTYPFFLLDIDLQNLHELRNGLFSLGGFNLFSFLPKDHFGASEDFTTNVKETLAAFGLHETQKIRFITLPRIANFVFNPISILVLFDAKDTPTDMLVEVHNYNGGRVVYPVKLEASLGAIYKGSVLKDMYVSPFLKRDGLYKFSVNMNENKMAISVTLHQENKKILIAAFSGSMRVFSAKSVLKLFCKHTFLTFWVVSRTLWQSLRPYFKGLKFHSVTPQDQIRRA